MILELKLGKKNFCLDLEVQANKMLVIVVFALIIASAVNTKTIERYTPDWNSLDTRPLPQWYDDAKIGEYIITLKTLVKI